MWPYQEHSGEITLDIEDAGLSLLFGHVLKLQKRKGEMSGCGLDLRSVMINYQGEHRIQKSKDPLLKLGCGASNLGVLLRKSL